MSRKFSMIEGKAQSEGLNEPEDLALMANAARILGRIRTPKKAEASQRNGKKSHGRADRDGL